MLLNAQALAQHANCGEPGGGNTGQLRGKGEAADATNWIPAAHFVSLGGLDLEDLLGYESEQCTERIDFQCDVRLDGQTALLRLQWKEVSRRNSAEVGIVR